MILALITVIMLTAVASYVHDHLKPSFKKQQNYLIQLYITLPVREFLAYDICTDLDDEQQGMKSKKNSNNSPCLRNSISFVRENTSYKPHFCGCIQCTASAKLLDPTSLPRSMLLLYERQRERLNSSKKGSN